MGEPIKLVCNIKGNPKPTVTFSKNGKQLISGGRVTVTCVNDTYTLEVKDATEADSGFYVITTENKSGKSEHEVQVKVEPPLAKPSFLSKPEDFSVHSSESIKISSKVTGNPKPAMTFFKDGKQLIYGGRVDVKREEDNYILQIKDATFEDSGTYLIMSENTQGKSSHELKVTVEPTLEEPSFEEKPQDVQVNDNEPVKLVCKVNGNPAPNVTWSKNGTVLTTSSRIKITSVKETLTYTLEITSATEEDSGTYTMTADSEIGKTSQDILVKVAAKKKEEKKVEKK